MNLADAQKILERPGVELLIEVTGSGAFYADCLERAGLPVRRVLLTADGAFKPLQARPGSGPTGEQ